MQKSPRAAAAVLEASRKRGTDSDYRRVASGATVTQRGPGTRRLGLGPLPIQRRRFFYVSNWSQISDGLAEAPDGGGPSHPAGGGMATLVSPQPVGHWILIFSSRASWDRV